MNIGYDTLAELKCTVCDLHLSVGPVTTNSSNKFVCGRCPSEANAANTVYEILAKKFAFPCRYQSLGCAVTVRWGAVQAHEQNCPKKPLPCPAVLPPGAICRWEGAIGDILGHFNKQHVEDVTDTYRVGVSLDKDIECCKLIKTEHREYILYIDFRSGQLKCSLKELASVDSFEERPYQLKLHAADFSQHVKLASRQIARYGESMDTNAASTSTSSTSTASTSIAASEDVIDVNIVKCLTSDSSKIICEVMLNNNTNIKRDLLRYLECSVCNKYMSSSIQQCRNGHSFCNSCIKKMQACSICKSPFRKRKNYTLELLADKIHSYFKNKKEEIQSQSTSKSSPDHGEKNTRCNVPQNMDGPQIQPIEHGPTKGTVGSTEVYC